MFFVELSSRAERFLDKLDEHTKQTLINGLKKLELNPHPKHAKFISRIEGDKIFRTRIGNYRALYLIDENDQVVLITKIDKRPRVYHR